VSLYHSPFTIQVLFALGMKREVPELLRPREGELALNLGPGNSPIAGTVALDLPDWDATKMPIPCDAGIVDTIFAFHFLEHFTGEQVIRILRECERVMRPGATMNVIVPHRLSQMAFQDLDHKSFWTEETWKELFSNPFYNKNREAPWRLHVRVNLIIGLVERNIALMTQLVKE
jgi:SAM-dependent methyltransferase